MGVFVDHVHNFRIPDILEVVEGLRVVLLAQIMNDDHFEVVLLIGEVYQVLNSAMGLHYQVDQVFIYDRKVVLE